MRPSRSTAHRLGALALTAALLCGWPQAIAAAAPDPALDATVEAVPPEKLVDTYRAGCPVGPDDLRLIGMNYWGYDGTVHPGELIVHKNVVDPVVEVFTKAFAARFPIARMQVMADFHGDDEAAMRADNTSAFNCRQVTGDPGTESQHSYGDAIDINTVENPYVDVNGRVHPAEAAEFLDRDRSVPGMIRPGDVVHSAMQAIGWQWGGRWDNPDYQHFSRNGRSL
ncbi:M15 family metallopeptidase [Streptomyces sp. RKAG293]|uniref:M15 family metallopeptidase n=1 Tax=Streptomyces sp. RKAG293 TaxID=2893403 RepID=UPI0020332A00|nr:M15 family metallopeptidase [Streptomyces sp. RKAG293]MCM2417411.1 M15 family metallopeptidase [Streptomyces sp. RKAG293]